MTALLTRIIPCQITQWVKSHPFVLLNIMHRCIWVYCILYTLSGVDPAFGSGGGCENNFFLPQAANVSDRMPRKRVQQPACMNFSGYTIDSDCTSWEPEGPRWYM